MKIISSVQHKDIKDIVRLETVKGRAEQQRFKAEGLRVCSALLESHCRLVQMYCRESLLAEVRRLCPEDLITCVEEPVLKKISSAATPSGIVGIFKIPISPLPEKLSSGIILYDCKDPGNMGTLVRTCAAMGKKSVVLIEGTDPWSPKVVQASAGALADLDIFKWTWQDLLHHKKNLKICALVVSNGQKPDEINFSDTLIMVGNEAHGIPSHAIEQSDSKVTLEMPGKTESLNAAIAGSIALYLAWHSTI